MSLSSSFLVASLSSLLEQDFSDWELLQSANQSVLFVFREFLGPDRMAKTVYDADTQVLERLFISPSFLKSNYSSLINCW